MKIDWPLLRKQKLMLVSMANDEDRLTSEVEVLDGILNFFDALQDDAVKSGVCEHIVFGCDRCGNDAFLDISPEGQRCERCDAWICDACWDKHMTGVVCKECSE